MQHHHVISIGIGLAFVSAGCWYVPEVDSDKSALVAGACPATIVVPADPKREDEARELLGKLSPDAEMSWSSERGAPASITGLALVVPCAKGELVGPTLLSELEGHGALFQVEADEWTMVDVPCGGLTGPTILAVQRLTYAGQGTTDSAAAIVSAGPWPTHVTLEAWIGHYLPPADPALVATLESCPDLDPEKAEEAADKHMFPFGIYDQCARVGEGEYQRQTGDLFAIGAAHWSYSEASDHVVLFKRTAATLWVAPSNHTPALLASDANCPVGTVGFDMAFDALTGALVASDPGIGNCVVCAAP